MTRGRVPVHGRVKSHRARRGAALVVALATLALLMAISVALHAVTLRERRSARRATLARAAVDAAEGALARWELRLGEGEPEALVAATLASPPGARLELEGTGGRAGDSTAGPSVHVTLVTFGGGVRLLVGEATARAASLRARRRVSLLMVPDSLAVPPGDTAPPRPRLVRAPDRAWAELP